MNVAYAILPATYFGRQVELRLIAAYGQELKMSISEHVKTNFEQVKSSLEQGKERVKSGLEHGKEIVKSNLDQGKEKVKSHYAYGKDIVSSGIEGAKEGRKTVLEAEATSDILATAAEQSWQAASFGVLAGAVLGALADDRKPVRGVVAGGILGAALAFGASFAWKTRPLTSAMAREAGKRIGHTRNRHWLSRNPINYG